MGLLELLLLIALVGLVAYALVHLVPMPAPFPTLIVGVAVILALVIIIRALGLDVALPRWR